MKELNDLNNKVILIVFVLISVFVMYFYLLSQSWTELPFSTCTGVESPYEAIFVPLELNGLDAIYSPDQGFNTCQTNILYHISPVISLLAGVILFGVELFELK